MTPSWDERWQQKITDPLPDPDPWLIAQQHLLSGGRAIDLACGRGRNSLLLAQCGYQVYALDSSATALDLLRTSATKNNLSIATTLFDLSTTLPTQPAEAELILSFYFLQRKLFPEIKKRIVSGGLFIGRSFCQLKPSDTEDPIIFEPGELNDLFADWDILAYEEGVENAQRGGTLAGIVARKP